MRILVIEDEVKIANAIKKGLELESFAVDAVYDGGTGKSHALSDVYDLIICDRMLPAVDGIEIITAMRENNIATPVLMLTAKSQIKDKISGLNAGADDYLTKPFVFDELLARVRALLRRPSQSLDSILSFRDLSLDTTSFTVLRGDEKINLSNKEFGLLEYLLRNANRIVTKDMIINHVWDQDADILTNTVEVYIGYLRNKIDKPFKKSPSLIHTVRGFGYKLGDKNG